MSRERGFVSVDDFGHHRIHACEGVTVDTQTSNPGWIDPPVQKRRDLLDFLSFGASAGDLCDPTSAQPFHTPRSQLE